MPKLIPEETKKEIIRLRVEERRTAPDIARRCNVSMPQTYWLLKKFPLSDKERSEKRRASILKMHESRGLLWTEQDIRMLGRMWPTMPRQKIEAAFPNRKWHSITRKAADLKIRRERTNSTAKNRAHPLFTQLRRVRENMGMTRAHLSDVLGYHKVLIARWELGEQIPRWRSVVTWADALDCDLKAQPRGK